MDRDHFEALRAGQYVTGFAIVFLAIAVIAAVIGFGGIAWVAAGICLALFVVGVMLIFESERQRQRRDRRRDRPAMRG